jgi:DNA-binding NtrC family response regulator
LSLLALERLYISKVLEHTGGNKGKAAKILGLDRRTLYRKVAEMQSNVATEAPDRGRDY